MGFRRRSRRRGLIAGAAIGAAAAHHHDQNQQDEAPAEEYQEPAAPAPAAIDPADEIAKLAELHSSGALTDEEFAAAKAKALGT